MYPTIQDLIPEGVETGAALALRDRFDRFIFFLAGTRFTCLDGELFYAGIGGHREESESWIECAHREAGEELGVDVEILSSDDTWTVSSSGVIERAYISDQPRPFVLYRMIHPDDAPRAGDEYYIVIYKALLIEPPAQMPPDEVRGVIALTCEQVMNGLSQKPSITELICEGAEIIASATPVDPGTRLYPIGTAAALAYILEQTASANSR